MDGMVATRLLRWTGVLFFMCLWALPAAAQDGAQLFKENCSSCHYLDRRGTGPALRGAVDRWGGDIDEMVKFVANSQAYIKGNFKNSEYAKKLYAEYNQTVMTSFAGLGDANIKLILGYIKDAPAAAAAAPADSSKAGGAAAGGGALISDKALFTGLLVLIAFLVGISLILILLVAVMINALRRKEAEPGKTVETFTKTLAKVAKSKFMLGAIGLIVAVGGANFVIKQARGVGLHKGYQPVQPIAFSHKIHAGQLGIDCNYCHTGVNKGKNATIPSTNICWNCHNDGGVVEGTNTGKGEIAKIKESHDKGIPIEWVRIHNLPDFVYFNHAQHYVVGKVACQTCHGPIEEMEEVYQFNDLSMGWCINCHRQTKLNIKESNYYRSIYANYHAEGLDSVTVEQIGGLSCARCHY